MRRGLLDRAGMSDTRCMTTSTNTWKRTSAPKAADTIYTSTTGYKVVGTGTPRRFVTYTPTGEKLPTGSFTTLRQAKAYADNHTPNAPAAKRPTTPGLTVVTHADGTTSTRTSKTRTYSHAIEVSPAPADRYAAYLTRQAEEQEAKALNLRTAASLGRGTIRSRGFKTQNDHVSYAATLTGTDVYTWCGEDRMTESDGVLVPVLPYLIDRARQSAEYADGLAAKLRAEAAAVLAAGTPVGEYMVVRWSSRADLAHQALGEFSWYASQGRTVRVVAVD